MQMVAANESGSYMFASYGCYTVVHRDGAVEEPYFPTVRDLLDRKLPVKVATRADKDRQRAEAFASSLRAQYVDANLIVEVLSGGQTPPLRAGCLKGKRQGYKPLPHTSEETPALMPGSPCEDNCCKYRCETQWKKRRR
ncbi:MAG: hypothetical protein IT342_18665 [Candidatus Melainabacteria bacterium]|nr:hypothetical protein [Candidatus Melainabacteria bacterium]